ncbi:lipoate--protein ligase family protein [Leptolyngbya sp. CCNP1308]|uniref:lipoate--protein ligase family protein n=1 Tax=Leptolyngbya sp. CCNP1308 TaxID=3110255 RepID=UPI002B21216A|nr:lipoate--protein ligase family protein [Leptolyngbya sp. CCNP1308]MEA5450943.1 lipoate--protein ligase family protein [Leptolyngbya sp. CCNP1308]
MSHAIWRLIPLLDAPGAVQMAIDTWLLDQHQHHGHPPTLRFYTWNPSAISLGASQRRQMPDHWKNLVWQGRTVDLVQRPTGGRGVLHQGDLTYALVSSNIAGSRDQAYRLLCQFLIAGWADLGVSLNFGNPNRDYSRSHNCFALATSADLVDAQGHKVIGSAQLRRDSHLLQHGSMGLTTDVELWQQVFQTPAPPTNQAQLAVQQGLTTSKIVESLTQAAEACFNCQLIAQPLTQREWGEIYALAQKNGPGCQSAGPSAVSSRI